MNEIYDGPEIDWSVYVAEYCGTCGHYHVDDCPDSQLPCGDYRCCIN